MTGGQFFEPDLTVVVSCLGKIGLNSKESLLGGLLAARVWVVAGVGG